MCVFYDVCVCVCLYIHIQKMAAEFVQEALQDEPFVIICSQYVFVYVCVSIMCVYICIYIYIYIYI